MSNLSSIANLASNLIHRPTVGGDEPNQCSPDAPEPSKPDLGAAVRDLLSRPGALPSLAGGTLEGSGSPLGQLGARVLDMVRSGAAPGAGAAGSAGASASHGTGSAAAGGAARAAAASSVPTRDQVSSGGDPLAIIEDARADGDLLPRPETSSLRQFALEGVRGGARGVDAGVSSFSGGAEVSRIAGVPVGAQVGIAAVRGDVTLGSPTPGQGNALSAGVTLAAAEAGAGIANRDGSVGANVAAGVTLLAAELTARSGANEATVGVSYGFGVGASVGLRDIDGNGIPELCVRGDARAVVGVSVGACGELGVATAVATQVNDAVNEGRWLAGEAARAVRDWFQR